MDDERDLVVFEDDAGNELTMEVLDYFFYEGNEYALLTEASEACEKLSALWKRLKPAKTAKTANAKAAKAWAKPM